MVIALTAISTGSYLASSRSRSVTTEVSMIPRWARWGSGTRGGVLGCNAVEVCTKPGQVDAWSTAEHGDSGIGAHETVPPKRSQLADRYAVPGDDEALALVQSPHDLAAVVPKLPLGDVSGHDDIVAPSATEPSGWWIGLPLQRHRRPHPRSMTGPAIMGDRFLMQEPRPTDPIRAFGHSNHLTVCDSSRIRTGTGGASQLSDLNRAGPRRCRRYFLTVLAK